MVTGCVASGEDVATQRAAIAIPGPWEPGPLTRSIAATQHTTVVDPPPVSPLGRCTSTYAFACSCTHPACMTAFPGTRDLNTYLLRRFTYLNPAGTYCCRQNSAMTRVPMLSVHSLGRAIDLGVPPAGGDADNTLGDAVANWLVENAEYIGIQRVIWDRAYWNGERGFGLLTAASLSHTDHIHVELTIAGANRTTAFFTSGASMSNTCTARCDGTRLIRGDCTSVDCAATGAPCVGGATPSCGAAAPPEPAEAARVASATIPSVTVSAAPARFTFIGPSRLFDTRTAADSASLVRSGAAGPITPASNGTFRAWSGLPSGATGVWLNVAAIGVGGTGFATAFASGTARPPTSTVNFIADIASSNATPVTLGSSGGVTVETISPAHVITDLYGAFSPTGAGFVPSGPTRVLDTRSDVGLTAGTTREIDVTAPAGSVGVVASVAVISGAAAGFVTAFPCGAAVPPTSNVNFAANAVVTNTITSTLGAGRLCLRSNVDAHVIVDVTGYLVPAGGLTYTALTPQRLLDTREATSLYSGRVGARQVLELPVQSMPGMPPNVGAVVANITAVDEAAPGFVTAFPCGASVPGTSSLNFPTGRAVGAVSVSALGAGRLCVFAFARTHLIVDVLGVWTGTTTTPTPPPDPTDPGDDPPPEGPDSGVDGGIPIDVASPDAPSSDASSVDASADSSSGDASAGDASEDRAASSDASDASATSDAFFVDTLDEADDDVPVFTPGDSAGSGGCGCRAQDRSAPNHLCAVTCAAMLAVMKRRRRRAR